MKTVESLQQEQRDYIAHSGGYYELREADDVYNDLNREQIIAFAREHSGEAWLGNINYYDEQRKNIAAGRESPYKKYTGQRIYNFEYSFCIPAPNEKLSDLIRSWNTPGNEKDMWNTISAITKLIAMLDGIQFIWY
ncbi:MAG: hypothetical protein AB7D36_05495 [Oscillospiraceae bacterium]